MEKNEPELVSRSVVPALVGFDVMEPVFVADVLVSLEAFPVVAWFVEVWEWEDGDRMMTVEPVPVEHECCRDAVRLPNGRIIFLGDQSVDDEAAAVRVFSERMERDRAARERRRAAKAE